MTAPAPELPEIAEDPRLHPPADPRDDEYGANVVAVALADGVDFHDALDLGRTQLARRARRIAGGLRRCFCCGRLLPPSALLPDPLRSEGLSSRCRGCVDVQVQDLYLRPTPGRRP